MIIFQHERVERVSHGRFEMLDNVNPVLAEVVVNVVIIRSPNKHVRPIPCLWQPKLLGVNFHRLGTKGALRLKDKCVVLFGDSVVRHEFLQRAFPLGLCRPLCLGDLSGVAFDESFDNGPTPDTIDGRNFVHNDVSIFITSKRQFPVLVLNVFDVLPAVHILQLDPSGNVIRHFLL
jgi:hypothetical protein